MVDMQVRMVIERGSGKAPDSILALMGVSARYAMEAPVSRAWLYRFKVSNSLELLHRH